MDVDQIETFLAIAQLKSFTRTARTLHRSQPAISRRIELLEQDLGAALLERIPGGVQLTTVGRAFLPYAEEMLAAMRDGRKSAEAAVQQGRETVSVALVGTLLDTQIVRALQRFARTTRAEFIVRTGPSWDVSQFVCRGEAALGVRYFKDSRRSLVCECLGHEPLRVVVAPHHKLARRPPEDPRELVRERFIGFASLRNQPEYFGNILRRKLGSIGIDEPNLMIIDSLAAQKRLIEAGLGVGLLPESSIAPEVRKRTLRVIGVPALETSMPIMLVQRRKGYLSPAARALRGLLQAERSRFSQVPLE